MTIAIVLSTHGSASQNLLNTTEMIIGKQKNVSCVDLLPSENTDILIQKYNDRLSQLNLNSGILFLVDTWGGTPFNAAYNLIINKENYDIITGVNIPMLIEIFISRENVHNMKELVHIALQSGSESIKSVKYPLTMNYYSNNLSQDKSKKHNYQTICDDKQIKINHMTICLARIDDRLIHGQVVTRWAKEYKINRIIVINNDISNDLIRKNLLKQVTPPGITAHVIDIKKAARVYNNPKYSKDKVIMLFTNPTDVLSLIEEGVFIESINIGSMSFQKGKKQISNAVSIDDLDIQSFYKLNQLGVKLEIRKVPSDTPLNLMELIKKFNK